MAGVGVIMAKTKLEFEDIQGLVLRGFKGMPQAGYAFFKIEASSPFKTWLSARLAACDITPADIRSEDVPKKPRQALAFTISGLDKLMGDGWLPNTFPIEFVEGMVQEHRSRLLGDVEANAPQKWNWGNDEGIDGVLIAFAETSNKVSDILDTAIAASHGMTEVIRHTAYLSKTEPFGFPDGISQPVIDGTGRAKHLKEKCKQNKNDRECKLHIVDAGEFILGYPDGSGDLPRSPAISPAADSGGLLQPHPERPELRDFGRNGSFMVIRQLAQDVEGFNKFIEANSIPDIDLGAKMVGRTKDGKTITIDSQATNDNDFDYLQDLSGMGCPIGAHVRRSNPRSTVHASSEQSSLKVTNRHRIIRRGRVYKETNGETGLIFLCLNASINRQFEFIQSTWCNDPFFQGLAGEADPIIGTQRSAAQGFTIPHTPFRHKINSLNQWVTVKGGAYFFLPSLSALKILGTFKRT